jgi:uncharacterized protein YbjT (DUF2867 family)
MTTDSNPLIFLMGVTGQTGRFILEEFDNNPSDVRVRIGVRKQADLERFRSEGRDAVVFDLDDPRTFGPALCGVDRMNILTGYTIAMTHQTKTVMDAAKKRACSTSSTRESSRRMTPLTPNTAGSRWLKPISR